MTFTLSCNNQTINAEVITNSFSKTEIYWNKLKQADNSARFQAIFTIELSNFLKTYINDDIVVEIKDGTTNKFFGYVRKNVKFSKTQINQPVAIEVISPSYLLDKSINNNLAYINKSVGYIVEDLLSRAGFNSTRYLSEITYAPVLITVKESDTFKSVITELLFEYGYGWDFDVDGIFYIYELFNVPSHAEITNTFDGKNSLNEIQITAKDQEFDCVRGTFNEITEYNDVLIFRDTTNANETQAIVCSQKVLPHKYFADKQFNYLDCDSQYGEIVYIESITPNVTSSNSSQMSWTMSKDELDTTSPNFGKPLGNQICFTALNNAGYDNYLTRIDCNGHVFVANAKTEVISYGSRKTNELNLAYITDSNKAQDFVKNLTNWFRYANNTIYLTSKTNYPLGSFVKVTDYGIGTYYGRIIQRQEKLTTDVISYTIETVEEFTPATTEEKKKPAIGGLSQSSIDSAINQANQYTESAIQEIELQASPTYQVVYNTPVIRRGTDGAFTPSQVKAVAYKTTDTQKLFIGDFEIKVNGEDYGTIQDSSINLDINQILETVSNLNTIEISFKTSGVNPLVISQYTIPVISGTSAYSVTLENPGTIFEANENGVVSSHTVTTKAHVYYGLQELEYLSETGWEYGLIEAPAGFTVNVDAVSGVISITNESGNIPEYGKIKIPVFIHSQTNTEYTVGYESGARAVVQMYVGFGENYEGYLTPDENGFFDAYFTWQKLTENAIKLHELSNTVEGYWNTLTNDRVITVAEKNTLRRILDGFIAEVAVYTTKYSKHKSYGPYFATFTELKKQIENILKTDGNYTFNSVESRNAFNNLFAQYYSNKENLDAEITTLGTNFTEIDTVNKINSLANDAKIGDYFVFTGNETVTAGDVEFLPGMTYVWNGDWWETDNNNEHIMATMSEAMSVINGQTADSIPAVTFAKRLIAMQVVTNELIAKYATVENLNVTNGKLTVTDETLSETNRTLSGVNQSLTETKTDLSQNYYTKTQLGTKSNETVIDGGNLKNDSVETRSLIVDDAFMERLATKILSLREGGIIKSDNWDGSFIDKILVLKNYNVTNIGDFFELNGVLNFITSKTSQSDFNYVSKKDNTPQQVNDIRDSGGSVLIFEEKLSDERMWLHIVKENPGSRPIEYDLYLNVGDLVGYPQYFDPNYYVMWSGSEWITTPYQVYTTQKGKFIQVEYKSISPILNPGTKGFAQFYSGKAVYNDEVIATNIHITGDSTFEGSGKFTGEVNANSGVFNNVEIKETCTINAPIGKIIHTENTTPFVSYSFYAQPNTMYIISRGDKSYGSLPFITYSYKTDSIIYAYPVAQRVMSYSANIIKFNTTAEGIYSVSCDNNGLITISNNTGAWGLQISALRFIS